MHYFCSYCDEGYLARLLCLRDSLREHGEDFRLLVLCFDSLVERVLREEADDDVVAIPLAEVLSADPAYAATRASRSRYEFYFTSTPVFVQFCLQRYRDADSMTYLDADLFFYAPPSAVFSLQGEASVGIVPHRFSPELRRQSIYGTYNVGWVSFRRDENGLACLAWWRERCLEWCHDHVDQGRFADQGYLNEFPQRFKNVGIIDHPGVNAAPWNMLGVAISSEKGGLKINGQPLLFYHFQGIREITPGWFDLGLGTLRTSPSSELVNFIYRPYLSELVKTQGELKRRYGIQPRLGYHRQHTGTSLKDFWLRIKGRWLLPAYRRLRGRMIHCPG